MEDLSGIIGILLIVVSTLAAIISKAKEAKHQKHTPVNTNGEINQQREAADSTPLVETPETIIEDEVDAYRRHVEKYRTPKPKTKITAPASTQDTQQEQTDDIMKGFNLQQAVVWSEILKSKFDEESSSKSI